jgi:Fe-S oxidoreductase
LVCAGSFDDRAKKITKNLYEFQNHVSLLYLEQKKVVLETLQKKLETSFLFQMQMMNIEVLNGYEAKKLLPLCPHCFNTTIKNEYPELGGKYEVVHHTEF